MNQVIDYYVVNNTAVTGLHDKINSMSNKLINWLLDQTYLLYVSQTFLVITESRD